MSVSVPLPIADACTVVCEADSERAIVDSRKAVAVVAAEFASASGGADRRYDSRTSVTGNTCPAKHRHAVSITQVKHARACGCMSVCV